MDVYFRSWRQQRWFAWHYPTDAELLQYFAFQVVSLQIHQHVASSNVNKIDILQYPNLRRLTIRQATPSQVNVIRADNFPHLEYLTLPEMDYVSFKVLCLFKSLRSCELQSLQIDDQANCSSPSIRSLILHKCDPSKLFYLFYNLPQLVSFKVNILWTQTSLQPFDSTAAFVHPNLRSLDVSMFEFRFSEDPIDTNQYDVVFTLLAHLSPNRHIRCRLSMFGMSNFNFEQLQRALHKLKSARFSCFLIYVL